MICTEFVINMLESDPATLAAAEPWTKIARVGDTIMIQMRGELNSHQLISKMRIVDIIYGPLEGMTLI